MKAPSLIIPLAILSLALIGARAQDLSQDPTVAPAYQITERGRDFATYTKVTFTEDSTGWGMITTNQFTLLENALHYQDDATGQWRESEDLIETFPDGAVARRGPNKAIFAHELNSQTVFDVQTYDGKRIRGGVRAIQLTDTATGQTVTLATVKNSVTAQLLPPNSILWADAFDGLKADLLINWKHNAWTHDILLKEQPELAPGWNAATARLEILTEFIVEADPDLRKSPARQDGIEDHVLIDFGAQAILVGKAFSIPENSAFNFGGDLQSEGSPFLKQWMHTDDGRRFLIESLDWRTASAAMQNLPLRRQVGPVPARLGPPRGPLPFTPAASNRSLARTWPKTPPPLADTDRKPIQLAAADYHYKPTGYLVDFLTISGNTPTTLTNGATYYIKTTYYSGNSLTIESGAIVKFKNNAYMQLYGPMTFPSSGPKAVFTGRNDDSVGDFIQNVSGETDSDGDPSSNRANPALDIYFDQNNITIRNTRFRWSKIGIKVERNSYDIATQTITNCFFENITGTGSGGIKGDMTKVTGTNLKRWNVTSPSDYPGPSMTIDATGIENDWPGDATWELVSTNIVTAAWPTNSNMNTPEIEGFASLTSVNVGGSIDFYIDVRSTTNSSDTNFTIQFYRMGWYGGAGGRTMSWYHTTRASSMTNLSLPSVRQPIPLMSTNGMVDCLATNVDGATQSPWTNSYTLNVPSWWPSGVYLVKLKTGTTAKENHMIFTVREDSRSSDLYFQNSVNTWQAYNAWGGNSVYPYPYLVNCDASEACPTCSPPRTTFGTAVSFNRPYARSCDTNLAYGTGAGEFFVMINREAKPGWEYNALRWIEKQGYDVTYCTDIDTHSGSLLNKSIKGFLSVGHDEYWSSGMRTNVEAARDRTNNPVNLAFLGANICFRVVHFDASLRSFACDKYSSTADEWRMQTNTPNHEMTMIGTEFIGNTQTALIVTNISGHWAFDYTGITNGGGQSLSGLLGIEVDGAWIGTCTNIIDKPATPNFGTNQYDTVKLADSLGLWISCQSAEGHAYATLYTNSIGGHALVFATGTLQWTWGLDDYGYSQFDGSYVSSVARQMTHNIFRKFTGQTTTPLP